MSRVQRILLLTCMLPPLFACALQVAATDTDPGSDGLAGGELEALPRGADVVDQAPPPAGGAHTDAETALTGAELEAFLRTAEVVDQEALAIGVTHSQRVTLSDGERTLHAVWKTIDEEVALKRFERGIPELGFTDTYRNEIAAYELDKLLELGMVPPTVGRRIGRRPGSMQLFIEGCVTEGERFKSKMVPPDPLAWSEQVYKLRLFRQLIYDTDYKNASNVLCDPQFRIWSIDHSRAFRTREELLNGDYLRRFSRSLLERLEALDGARLEESLGAWLSPKRIEALLVRRDLILEHAAREVSRRGEETVLYP